MATTTARWRLAIKLLPPSTILLSKFLSNCLYFYSSSLTYMITTAVASPTSLEASAPTWHTYPVPWPWAPCSTSSIPKRQQREDTVILAKSSSRPSLCGRPQTSETHKKLAVMTHFFSLIYFCTMPFMFAWWAQPRRILEICKERWEMLNIEGNADLLLWFSPDSWSRARPSPGRTRGSKRSRCSWGDTDNDCCLRHCRDEKSWWLCVYYYIVDLRWRQLVRQQQKR